MDKNANEASAGAPLKPPSPKDPAQDNIQYYVVDARHCGSGKLSYWEIMIECVIRRPGDVFLDHVFITLTPSTINPGGVCYIVRDEVNLAERTRLRLNYREVDLEGFALLDDLGEVYRKELWDLVVFHETITKEFPQVIFVRPLLLIIDKHRVLRGLPSLAKPPEDNQPKKEKREEEVKNI